MGEVEVEYIPEKTELDGDYDEEFRKVFEKFSFKDTLGSEENDKKDETAANAALKKKDDSDSEEEEQDVPQKREESQIKRKRFDFQFWFTSITSAASVIITYTLCIMGLNICTWSCSFNGG
ncbi:hypothetical protein U1Q18_022644 [Sarracenia purpurea var. burkii]